MVGHSYGNIAIVYYMLQHGSDTSLPKLVKQVDTGLSAWMNRKKTL